MVEGVYSMDGDLPVLPEIVDLCKRYDARIMIDEAHSAFIFGENGRGVAEHFGLEDEIDIHMGTFSKSLGGIGGTAFTPIVNAPEVAILGVSRSQVKPIYRNGEFTPRLMLPISLSYDHRVIDGADAARFTTRLKSVLSDIRDLLF